VQTTSSARVLVSLRSAVGCGHLFFRCRLSQNHWICSRRLRRTNVVSPPKVCSLGGSVHQTTILHRVLEASFGRLNTGFTDKTTYHCVPATAFTVAVCRFQQNSHEVGHGSTVNRHSLSLRLRLEIFCPRSWPDQFETAGASSARRRRSADVRQPWTEPSRSRGMSPHHRGLHQPRPTTKPAGAGGPRRRKMPRPNTLQATRDR
jgi:hypothetical protein